MQGKPSWGRGGPFQVSAAAGRKPQPAPGRGRRGVGCCRGGSGWLQLRLESRTGWSWAPLPAHSLCPPGQRSRKENQRVRRHSELEQHGWKPPESPHLASPGAEERQGHPAAHAAPPQGAQAASSPPARSSRHTQKSPLALGFSQHRKRSELSPQVLALLLARSLKKLSGGSRSWGWSLSLSPLRGSGWGHGSLWAPQQKMWGAGAEL